MNWLPIETAPKVEDEGIMLSDGKSVAIGSPSGYQTRVWPVMELYDEWYVYPQVWDGDGDRGGLATIEFRPTHWMPLPPPPKNEEPK